MGIDSPMKARADRPTRLACIAGSVAVLACTIVAPSAAQHIDAGPILVTQARASALSVAAAEDGTMTFLWVEQPDITSTTVRDAVRLFSNAGQPLSAAAPTGTGGASQSSFYGPDIAALPGGGYMIASRRGIAHGVNALDGLRLDATAVPLAAPFEVQGDPNGLFTNSVAALPSGAVFVWRQNELWSRRVDVSAGISAKRICASVGIGLPLGPLCGAGLVGAAVGFLGAFRRGSSTNWTSIGISQNWAARVVMRLANWVLTQSSLKRFGAAIRSVPSSKSSGASGLIQALNC